MITTKVNSKLNTKIYLKTLIILCFIYFFLDETASRISKVVFLIQPYG